MSNVIEGKPQTLVNDITGTESRICIAFSPTCEKWKRGTLYSHHPIYRANRGNGLSDDMVNRMMHLAYSKTDDDCIYPPPPPPLV